VVDTSELYGRGKAEMLVGIAGAGFDLFIVTKVQPPRFTADEVAGRLYASWERLKRFPTVVMNHWIPADSDCATWFSRSRRRWPRDWLLTTA